MVKIQDLTNIIRRKRETQLKEKSITKNKGNPPQTPNLVPNGYSFLSSSDLDELFSAANLEEIEGERKRDRKRIWQSISNLCDDFKI